MDEATNSERCMMTQTRIIQKGIVLQWKKVNELYNTRKHIILIQLNNTITTHWNNIPRN